MDCAAGCFGTRCGEAARWRVVAVEGKLEAPVVHNADERLIARYRRHDVAGEPRAINFQVTCAGTDPAAFFMVNTHVPEMSIFDWAVAAAPQMIMRMAAIVSAVGRAVFIDRSCHKI